MKIFALIPVAMALGLSAYPGGLAFAQSNQTMREQAHRQAQNSNLRKQAQARQYAPNDPRYREGRGIGEQRYYPGDSLPREYRNRTYVVDDWRSHRLTPPPRGYQWVQIGRDYALVANRNWAIRTFGQPEDPAAVAQ